VWVWTRGHHDVLLTKGAFFAREYLDSYARAPPGARDLVDRLRNCEDLLFALTWAAEAPAHARSIFVDASVSPPPSLLSLTPPPLFFFNHLYPHPFC
jgi:hypothetical protein